MDQTSAMELIVFKLGDQEYCVDIMQVREIRGWTQATPIPHAPPYVIGVINLRGTVLPVVDLPARLGMSKSNPANRHAIIVIQLMEKIAGLLVDAVSDIITIGREAIQATPELASEIAQRFVTGVATVDGRMISVISLDHVLRQQDLKSHSAAHP
jgi:purine-binding chemotaxis protein CheW